VRYGGNTTCLELVTDSGYSLIVDAGTGIRKLGQRMAESVDVNNRSLNLLLTHCHWDHIQGLPFFEPLRDSETKVAVRVPAHLLPEADRILQAQLDSLFFPVARSDLRAEISFRGAVDGETVQDARVRSCPVVHPGGAVTYRVDADGDETRSVVVAPDSEMAPDSPVNAPLRALASGAKILVHDAMYLEEEYDTHRGWGHSTHLAAVQLAIDVKAELLVLFHHHPDRNDAQVGAMLEESRAFAANAGDLLVVAAYEGLELEL
jgi:phosphoribosyl 1,2-cyclic phosphodiesterase